MTKPKISVVVLNWNGKKFIDGFLRTLDNQTYPKKLIELVFVDNNSSDDSVSYFKEKISKLGISYTLQLNKDNYGYAQGNNLGIQRTSGDYILVCNNDLELDKDLIKNLLDTAHKSKSSVTVPKLMYLNKPGYINNAGSHINYSSSWPIIEIGANEKDSSKYNRDYEITAFCGACVLFERKFLEKVGLFDKRFFMYFEDGDLSWRGQKAGHKYCFSAQAIAFHYHTGSSKEGSPLFNHYVGRNRLLILHKNGSLRQIYRAWGATIKDHLLLRIKNITLGFFGKYPKKLALREFLLSQKMLISTVALVPYATGKRLGFIKEDLL